MNKLYGPSFRSGMPESSAMDGHDGSVKACFDNRIGNAKLASPVKASFDAPNFGILSQNLIRKMFLLSVIPAWTAGIQIAGMPQTPPSMEPRFRRSMPERRGFRFS